MTFSPCPHEKEVTEALHAGRWPDGCVPELRTHVDACRSCNDLVLVTQTFQRARHASVQVAHLDAPGVLWWRAQLQRRNAAVVRATKPIAAAQLFALLLNVVAIVGFLVLQPKYSVHWISQCGEFLRTYTFNSERFWSFLFLKPDWNLMLLIPSLGVLALLGGVVLYLAVERQ